MESVIASMSSPPSLPSIVGTEPRRAGKQLSRAILDYLCHSSTLSDWRNSSRNMRQQGNSTSYALLIKNVRQPRRPWVPVQGREPSMTKRRQFTARSGSVRPVGRGLALTFGLCQWVSASPLPLGLGAEDTWWRSMACQVGVTHRPRGDAFRTLQKWLP